MNKSAKIKKLAKQYKVKLLADLKRVSLGKKVKTVENTMWVDDIADHIAICNAILSNKPNTFGMLQDLDTASREAFPDPLYILIRGYDDEEEEL